MGAAYGVVAWMPSWASEECCEWKLQLPREHATWAERPRRTVLPTHLARRLSRVSVVQQIGKPNFVWPLGMFTTVVPARLEGGP